MTENAMQERPIGFPDCFDNTEGYPLTRDAISKIIIKFMQK